MPSFEDAVEALDRRVTVCARFSEAAFPKKVILSPLDGSDVFSVQVASKFAW